MAEFTTAFITTLITGSIVILILGYINYRAERNRRNQTPDLSTTISQAIEEKIDDGSIEDEIKRQFDNMVEKTVGNLFGNYGVATSAIEEKLKEIMIPTIEKYDFNKHTIGLEQLVNSMMERITSRQDNLLQDVHQLFIEDPIEKITVSDLFDRYVDMIAKEVDVSKLEISYDDDVSYETMIARLDVSDPNQSTDRTEKRTVKFICEQDPSLNLVINLFRWRWTSSSSQSQEDNEWQIWSVYQENKDDGFLYPSMPRDITSLDLPINNLRKLNDFEICLIRLSHDKTTVDIDLTEELLDDIEVEAEPEATFE